MPFVALTTMQMREAAERGSLDGFILEYQSYINDTMLSKNYKFTPYGYRHDNPLLSIESASPEKKKILSLCGILRDRHGKSEGRRIRI